MKALVTELVFAKKGANYMIVANGVKLFSSRDEKKVRHQFENNKAHWLYWANSASVSVQQDILEGKAVTIIARG